MLLILKSDIMKAGKVLSQQFGSELELLKKAFIVRRWHNRHGNSKREQCDKGVAIKQLGCRPPGHEMVKVSAGLLGCMKMLLPMAG